MLPRLRPRFHAATESYALLAVALVAVSAAAVIVTSAANWCPPSSAVLVEALPMLNAASGKPYATAELTGTNAHLSRAPGAPVRVGIGSSLEVRGLALDPRTGKPAAAVFAVLDDGKPYRASLERSPPGGFYAVIPGNDLSSGYHRVRVRIVSETPPGYYEGPRLHAVLVR